MPNRWVSVYSSTIPRDWSRDSNIEGVIQGSKTSQPPILSPRTGVEPKANSTERGVIDLEFLSIASVF